MRRLCYFMVASVALANGALFLAVAARADSLSCSSVNGVTRCIGSDGLDCQTVEGRMVCAPGSKGSCETAQGVTTCRNGGGSQSFRTSPPSSGEQGGRNTRQSSALWQSLRAFNRDEN